MSSIKLSVQIADDKQTVVIGAETIAGDNREDRSYIISPTMAVDIANALLHCAEDCGVEIKMETLGITDAKRARIIKRCEHVIRSLSNRKPLYVSCQVVDTVLAEVL